MKNFEDVTPNPEYLIKSIAEQGYSLETALADLIDNSISANASQVEILIDIEQKPFTLFLADNGEGMSETILKKSMRFPSTSPDNNRMKNDLGRFGLGMKTASFSQTRKFTVLSRSKGRKKYCGRTWDLDLLKSGKWQILVNTDDEINSLLVKYKFHSSDMFDSFENYEANTIIIWEGLHKFEDYLEEKNQKKALKKEITEVTTDHLSLVFHRFMEKKENKLEIRVNNKLLEPFNPFPTHEKDIRLIEFKQKGFGTDSIKLEGFILPSRCIEETKNSITHWTTKHRSLTDMEGIYIYRADRIIIFGGWNGIIKKGPKLQLARLRVEIGNKVDHLLHLNVAKSQVIIPHDLKDAFESYITELKTEATREFFNRTTVRFPTKKENKINLFERNPSNKGILLELNNDFPILEELNKELSLVGKSHLKILLKMINTQVNIIRESHEDKVFLDTEKIDEISTKDIVKTIKNLKENGIEPNIIKKEVLPRLGYQINSFPDEILKELND
jgi:hypothetical protein